MFFAACHQFARVTHCCHEPVSSFTHLVGAVWFAVWARPLLQKAEGDAGRKLALGIYAASCVFLLFASGFYHWFSPGIERVWMRRLDLAAIFLLISGTFTPLCTILYRGTTRWGSLGVIWTIALAGIGMRTLYSEAFPEEMGTPVFLGFGWLGAIFAIDLWFRHNFRFVQPLIWGGVAYTLGTLLLHSELPIFLSRVASSHDLWHVAVLIGIGCHWHFVSQLAEVSLPGSIRKCPQEAAPSVTWSIDDRGSEYSTR